MNTDSHCAPADAGSAATAPHPRARHGMARLAFVLAAFLPVLANAAACGQQSSSGGAAAGPVLAFPSNLKPVTAGSSLFGGSTLYNVDDDAFWTSPNGIASLKAAHVRTLRYPGGGVADNYDWETNSLVRPNEWPKDAPTQAERDQRTDYLEFLAAAKKADIKDIFFVVNLDSAVRDKGDLDANLQKYAAKAARWVKAVKDHGYRVEYWEIGNEMYLPTNPVSASEYARALNYYSKAMKAVDPTIKIGAVGPIEIDESSFADKIGSEALKEIRAKADETGSKPCEGERARECVKTLKKGHRKETVENWWPALLSRAKDSFDFVAVHRYKLVKFPPRGSQYPATDNLQTLERTLSNAKGRHVPIALTEWNIPGDLHRKRALPPIDHLMNVGIYLGNNAVGGVDFAHFWPFRTKSKDFGTLLTTDGQLTAVGHLFEATSTLIPDAPVSEAALSDTVYALRVGGSSTRGTVIVNTGAGPATVEFSDGAKGKATITRFVGGEGGAITEQPAETSECDAGTARITAPAQSITVLSIQ